MNATGWGENVADETAEKFISSLEMFVWCEPQCHNSASHGRLVLGELMFWFPDGFRRILSLCAGANGSDRCS